MPETFADRVLALVETIPAGRVMTYGSVAIELGTRAARAVGQTMARYGDEVPWWRVVPASGQPIRGHAAESLAHYLDEGTPLSWPQRGRGAAFDESAPGSWRIDLATAHWHPGERPESTTTIAETTT